MLQELFSTPKFRATSLSFSLFWSFILILIFRCCIVSLDHDTYLSYLGSAKLYYHSLCVSYGKLRYFANFTSHLPSPLSQLSKCTSTLLHQFATSISRSCQIHIANSPSQYIVWTADCLSIFPELKKTNFTICTMAAICFLFYLSFYPQERFNFHQEFHEKILLFNNNKLGKFHFWDSNLGRKWTKKLNIKGSLLNFCSEEFEVHMNSSSYNEGFGKFANYENVAILSRQVSNMDFERQKANWWNECRWQIANWTW
jgi:hypothetical protein